MKNFINRFVFFIGWMLSPLTFWNDAFFNIPISFACAFLLSKIIPADFICLMLASYWFTNILGIVLMMAAGKGIFHKGRVLRDILSLLMTMAAYSIAIVLARSIWLHIQHR